VQHQEMRAQLHAAFWRSYLQEETAAYPIPKTVIFSIS
jgi:hypothetical protein